MIREVWLDYAVAAVRSFAALLTSGPSSCADTVALMSISIPRTEASFNTVKSVGFELWFENSLRTDSGRAPISRARSALDSPRSSRRFSMCDRIVSIVSISARFCS